VEEILAGFARAKGRIADAASPGSAAVETPSLARVE
jgi:hypothetical protein